MGSIHGYDSGPSAPLIAVEHVKATGVASAARCSATRTMKYVTISWPSEALQVVVPFALLGCSAGTPGCYFLLDFCTLAFFSSPELGLGPSLFSPVCFWPHALLGSPSPTTNPPPLPRLAWPPVTNAASLSRWFCSTSKDFPGPE